MVTGDISEKLREFYETKRILREPILCDTRDLQFCIVLWELYCHLVSPFQFYQVLPGASQNIQESSNKGSKAILYFFLLFSRFFWSIR